MQNIRLPYGSSYQTAAMDERSLKAVVMANRQEGAPGDGRKIVRLALEHPVGSERLSELSRGRRRVLLITSDHTRPLPSRLTLPLFLQEIRKGSPDAEIRILVATGMHRAPTPEEMDAKFGSALLSTERFVIHDSRDEAAMAPKGLLPSGGELRLNGLVDWADLVVSEGFIEPHFFAGFSGGSKSVLPGIASAKTVLYNHNAVFIADPNSVQGSLDGNPIQRDIVHAARRAGLAFILNVLLDDAKRVVAAFAGHPEQAHLAGCALCLERSAAPKLEADIAITTNGGYPLDQNIYQAVKGMSAGARCVREGGVLIMLAECRDGHGGESFYRWFLDRSGPAEVERDILSIAPEDTLPDQWEAQILARILKRCACVFVTLPENRGLVEAMHMRYAETVGEALSLARGLLGEGASVCVIPDGVGVVFR